MDGALYDLTALGQEEYVSFGAWLRAAQGRVAEALDDLARMPSRAQALCTSAELEDPNASPMLLAPIDVQEVWACGVTYKMSREARMRESEEPTIYGRVYDAPRPEIFFKATPHRVVGPEEAVGIRADSSWNVPEPELTLVLTPKLEIVGYTVGNDMSSRDIEGENPLYLPQAKVYDRCCALGPVVRLLREFDPLDQGIRCVVWRQSEVVFEGETHTSRIHRPLENLVTYLGRCNSFPNGAFVLTGTGIVPPDTFTLREGDIVEITIEGLGTLRNPVVELPLEEGA
ncbi:MAG: fumarylacetoacetate hydrolase family protein [Anaerolineae bacterium]|nr:fumarylacetoacetate hydrolase family protein [Anaerolineae bacterium]